MEQANNKTTSLTPAQQSIMSFTSRINGNYVQNQLRQVLGSNAGTFATSLVEIFTNDTKLQECDQKRVVQEAIKAATLKLPMNKQLGYAYIVVYNNWNKELRKAVPTPTLIIGWKGLVQLALRSGQYRNINADTVYEGELLGFDKLTGAIDLSGSRQSDRVIGFFAHFELVNGFRKTLYMSLDDMARYALKFSPTFKRDTKRNPIPTADELCDLAQSQISNGTAEKVGWEGNFESMALKTVLRRLLSKFGYLSIEMMNAMRDDDDNNTGSSPESQRDEENAESKPVFDAQAEEIVDTDDSPKEECPI